MPLSSRKSQRRCRARRSGVAHAATAVSRKKQRRCRRRRRSSKAVKRVLTTRYYGGSTLSDARDGDMTSDELKTSAAAVTTSQSVAKHGPIVLNTDKTTIGSTSLDARDCEMTSDELETRAAAVTTSQSVAKLGPIVLNTGKTTIGSDQVQNIKIEDTVGWHVGRETIMADTLVEMAGTDAQYHQENKKRVSRQHAEIYILPSIENGSIEIWIVDRSRHGTVVEEPDGISVLARKDRPKRIYHNNIVRLGIKDLYVDMSKGLNLQLLVNTEGEGGGGGEGGGEEGGGEGGGEEGGSKGKGGGGKARCYRSAR